MLIGYGRFVGVTSVFCLMKILVVGVYWRRSLNLKVLCPLYLSLMNEQKTESILKTLTLISWFHFHPYDSWIYCLQRSN